MYTEKNVNQKFGCAKGSVILSPDFEEPLDDFKEYMPIVTEDEMINIEI